MKKRTDARRGAGQIPSWNHRKTKNRRTDDPVAGFFEGLLLVLIWCRPR
jgi:hypothetical protein